MPEYRALITSQQVKVLLIMSAISILAFVQFPDFGTPKAKIGIICKDNVCTPSSQVPEYLNSTVTQDIIFKVKNEQCLNIKNWMPMGRESIRIENLGGRVNLIFPVWDSKTQKLTNNFSIQIPRIQGKCEIAFKIEKSRKYILTINDDLVYSQRYNEPVFGIGSIKVTNSKNVGFVDLTIYSPANPFTLVANFVLTILIILLGLSFQFVFFGRKVRLEKKT